MRLLCAIVIFYEVPETLEKAVPHSFVELLKVNGFPPRSNWIRICIMPFVLSGHEIGDERPAVKFSERHHCDTHRCFPFKGRGQIDAYNHLLRYYCNNPEEEVLAFV